MKFTLVLSSLLVSQSLALDKPVSRLGNPEQHDRELFLFGGRRCSMALTACEADGSSEAPLERWGHMVTAMDTAGESEHLSTLSEIIETASQVDAAGVMEGAGKEMVQTADIGSLFNNLTGLISIVSNLINAISTGNFTEIFSLIFELIGATGDLFPSSLSPITSILDLILNLVQGVLPNILGVPGSISDVLAIFTQFADFFAIFLTSNMNLLTGGANDEVRAECSSDLTSCGLNNLLSNIIPLLLNLVLRLIAA